MTQDLSPVAAGRLYAQSLEQETERHGNEVSRIDNVSFSVVPKNNPSLCQTVRASAEHRFSPKKT